MTFHFTPNPDGTLSGDANGSPINFGYYTGDEFFKVDFPAGLGRWEVWARVDSEGYIEGMISVGGNKGFPNLVYGKKLTKQYTLLSIAGCSDCSEQPANLYWIR